MRCCGSAYPPGHMNSTRILPGSRHIMCLRGPFPSSSGKNSMLTSVRALRISASSFNRLPRRRSCGRRSPRADSYAISLDSNTEFRSCTLSARSNHASIEARSAVAIRSRRRDEILPKRLSSSRSRARP